MANLQPSYFAMVMGTGIVSLAVTELGWNQVGVCLFGLNLFLLSALMISHTCRILFYREQVLKDLYDHQRGVGYFTLIAALSITGATFDAIGGLPVGALIFWGAAIVTWTFITYGVLLFLTTGIRKPELKDGIHGGWLVTVVATQSVSALSMLSIRHLVGFEDLVCFSSVSLWLMGILLYIWIAGLIFYRQLFFHLAAEDLTALYWVNMGAMAISTLAGCLLLAEADKSSVLLPLKPFVHGLVLFCWAVASWWIPLLILQGVWRHLFQRHPLKYDVQFWGMVFPLGMYSVCSFRLIATTGVPVSRWIPIVFAGLAMVVWSFTFAGWLVRVIRFGRSAKPWSDV